MEFEVIYSHNGQKEDFYYVTIEINPFLLQEDIENSIMHQLKKHVNYCSATDSLKIISINRRY